MVVGATASTAHNVDGSRYSNAWSSRRIRSGWEEKQVPHGELFARLLRRILASLRNLLLLLVHRVQNACKWNCYETAPVHPQCWRRKGEFWGQRCYKLEACSLVVSIRSSPVLHLHSFFPIRFHFTVPHSDISPLLAYNSKLYNYSRAAFQSIVSIF